ncbi:MAG: glycosyltransferase family 4 protein [Herpetosiphonaceae bacterium]|nr:glycosyltransferase family 4 protein [Herpetosiphonaceae bacterium]
MRILMIASSFPKYPGEMTAPFIEEIAAAVAERGHEVHMLLPDHPELRRGALERGIHLHRYAYAPHPRLSVWGYAGALDNDVRMRHAALLVAPLAVAAGWAALRRLTAMMPFAIIHAHWAIPNGLPALLVARERGIPLVVSTHGSDISVAERSLPTALAARSVMRYATAITAPSSDLTTRAAALGGPPERMLVLPYCVDAVAFRPDLAARAQFRAAHGLSDGHQLLFSVGRMVEKKGFIYLVRAFAQIVRDHPNARLMIAGYGGGQAALEAEAARLGVREQLIFPGAIGHNDINAALNAADVFVLPSVRDRSGNVDGLPNTLLEAMGAGRPIVASRIAGVPAVVTTGEHGLLVPPAEPAALAAAISRMLSDPGLAAHCAATARQRVERELTWAKYAERLEQVYVAGARG